MLGIWVSGGGLCKQCVFSRPHNDQHGKSWVPMLVGSGKTIMRDSIA